MGSLWSDTVALNLPGEEAGAQGVNDIQLTDLC